MKWYYYLHENGNLLGKNPVVVDDEVLGDASYFDSPFVKNVWLIHTEDRESLWRMLLEALAMGAKVGRVAEIAMQNGCNFRDSLEMLKRLQVAQNDLFRKGMKIFIEKVLEMSEKEYWDKVVMLAEAEKKEG